MNSIKHFCYAMFFFLTFFALLYTHKVMSEQMITASSRGIWLVSFLAMVHLGKTLYHLSLMMESFSGKEPTYEDFIP